VIPERDHKSFSSSTWPAHWGCLMSEMSAEVSATRRFVKSQKRLLYRIIVVLAAIFLVPRVLEQLLYGAGVGLQARFLVGVSAYLIILVLGVIYLRKALPPGSLITSEKSASAPERFEAVCDVIAGVLAKDHWKLIEADKQRGHFEARKIMTLRTFRPTLLIDVGRMDGGSAKVHVLCGTRSLNDPAHNDKMIDDFLRELEDSLKNSKA